MRKFFCTLILFCTLASLASADEAALRARTQDLLVRSQSSTTDEFSSLLERPDLAVLDGRIVTSAELQNWLQEYLDRRTVTGTQQSPQQLPHQARSMVLFEEQPEPLVLDWVILKDGKHFLRGVQAPLPAARSTNPSSPTVDEQLPANEQAGDQVPVNPNTGSAQQPSVQAQQEPAQPKRDINIDGQTVRDVVDIIQRSGALNRNRNQNIPIFNNRGYNTPGNGGLQRILRNGGAINILRGIFR